MSGRPDQGNTMQTEQGNTSQVVILYEPTDGDEEMIDVTRDNNRDSGTSETVWKDNEKQWSVCGKET